MQFLSGYYANLSHNFLVLPPDDVCFFLFINPALTPLNSRPKTRDVVMNKLSVP